MKTTKHKQNAEKLERRKLRDEGIITSLREFFKNSPNVVGASVPLEDQAYRFQVTSTLLAAGIPLLKADALRNLLERSGHPMTTSRSSRSEQTSLSPSNLRWHASRGRGDQHRLPLLLLVL